MYRQRYRYLVQPPRCEEHSIPYGPTMSDVLKADSIKRIRSISAWQYIEGKWASISEWIRTHRPYSRFYAFVYLYAMLLDFIVTPAFCYLPLEKMDNFACSRLDNIVWVRNKASALKKSILDLPGNLLASAINYVVAKVQGVKDSWLGQKVYWAYETFWIKAIVEFVTSKWTELRALKDRLVTWLFELYTSCKVLTKEQVLQVQTKLVTPVINCLNETPARYVISFVEYTWQTLTHPAQQDELEQILMTTEVEGRTVTRRELVKFRVVASAGEKKRQVGDYIRQIPGKVFDYLDNWLYVKKINFCAFFKCKYDWAVEKKALLEIELDHQGAVIWAGPWGVRDKARQMWNFTKYVPTLYRNWVQRSHDVSMEEVKPGESSPESNGSGYVSPASDTYEPPIY